MEHLYKLKNEFLNIWNFDRVKNMTLDEYTNLNREDSFCYWLESTTTILGSIWGGSAYKFGVYKRSDINTTVDADNRKTDGEYAWFTKYGDTKEEAFESIKAIIIEIIECVKSNNLNKIDRIDLGPAYKWKIAFLYSDFKVINIFKYEALRFLALQKGFIGKKHNPISKYQEFLMERKPENIEYFDYTHSLWREYDDSIKKSKPKSEGQKQLFVNWLLLNKLDIQIVEELEVLSEEVLAKGYFEKGIYDCVEYEDVYHLASQEPIDDNWDGLYSHYFYFVLEQIRDRIGVNLHIKYAIVTVKDPQELEAFINNNIWSGTNKVVYENYINKFKKGDQIAIYRRKDNLIEIEAIGVILHIPQTGFDLKVKWYNDFKSFKVNLNSEPNNLDFYEIEAYRGNDRIEDIKNIFCKIKINNDAMTQPHNQILYGPPGTSKTYQTKKIAVEIIDNLDYSDTERNIILHRYDELYEAGQINFTTFHQSISYEDFIEGIKPVLYSDTDDIDVSDSKNGSVSYEIKDGIFKKLCNTAKGISGNIDSSSLIDFQNKNFYKMSLGGKHRLDRHNWSIDNNLIFLGWGGENDFTHLNKIKEWKKFKEQFNREFPELVADSKYVIQAVYIFQNMQIGDIVVVSKGNKIIDAIGIIESDYFYDESKDMELFQFRKVKWLATNMNASPELFIKKGISQQTIYQFYNKDIKFETFVDYFNKPVSDIEHKRYVLIIDEINRGNISSIFGELITLIETEKRKGIKESNPEFIEVELPYSNDKFSVPDNLYIIGTMNTADRSVESLDTALRRRFSFVEMQPNPALLTKEHSEKGVITEKGVEINLIKMLTSINERVELLIDKDHQIGHSFFINVNSLEVVKVVFRDKIIPLLEEYFYGDFGKIGLVLGGNFVKPKTTKTNFAKNFKYGEDGDVTSFSDKIIYEFTPFEKWDTMTFTSIYE